jgi:cytochrome P450
MVLLLGDRSRWEALCADPGLVPNAVEECLRSGPSLTTNRRLCVKDTVIGGVRIPAGAKVLLGVAAANCDPEVFDQPDVFDLRRPTAKRHLTFGYGPHTCLGAPLARLQMRVALEELARRVPDMRLVPDQTLEYVPTASARAPRALRVEWSQR